MRALALGVALCGVFAAGCSSAPEGPFVPEPTHTANGVRVYVYWPGQRWREKAGKTVEVELDGVPVGVLSYKSYIPLEVRPGHHHFRVTGDSDAANWEGLDKSFEMRFKPGEVRYVRFLVKYNQEKNTWTNPGMSYVVQFLPRSASSAKTEMAGLEPAER